MYFKNPIDKLRAEIKNIENIIETEQLKAEVRKELVKLLESLREILRTEVDERIEGEKANATEERDKQWQDFINQKYVKKEIVIDLNKRIKEMEITIKNLRNENKDKDDLLRNNQYEISQLNALKEQDIRTLKNEVNDYFRENNNLRNENQGLHDYIKNRLDYDVRWNQGQRKILNSKIIKINEYKKTQQIKINKENSELEIQKKQLNEREKKLKKDKDELYTSWITMSEIKNNLENWQDDIKNQQENIKKRWETVLKTAEKQRTEGQRLQEWKTRLNKTVGFNKFSLPCPSCRKPMLFDITNQETNQKLSKIFGNYMHSECKTKSEQVRHVTLRPVLFSGEPVVQSGFSPIIQSVGETKVAESSGGPVLQSGYSPYYYFGTENLNNKT